MSDDGRKGGSGIAIAVVGFGLAFLTVIAMLSPAVILFNPIAAQQAACATAATVSSDTGYVPDSTPRGELFTTPNPSVVAITYAESVNYTKDGKHPSAKVQLSLFETTDVESGFHVWWNTRVKGSQNLPHDKYAQGSDHYSTGAQQQQSGANGQDGYGWGPMSANMDPKQSADAYLSRAMELEPKTGGDEATLAQAVQVSATGDGSTYRGRRAKVQAMIDKAKGDNPGSLPATDAASDPSASAPSLGCCVTTSGTTSAPGVWKDPVDAPHGVGFWVAGGEWHWKGHHTGVDYKAAAGTPIHPASTGTVENIVGGGDYGLHVIIDHGDIDGAHIETLYAHMSKYGPGLHVGQHVTTADVIGYVGETGNAFGPHLHFEVHRNYTNGADNATFLDGWKFIAAHQGTNSPAAITAAADKDHPNIVVSIATWNSAFWNNTRDVVEGARTIAAKADVIGFQELSPQSKRNTVHAALSEHYDFTQYQNQTQIGWNRDKYTLVKQGEKLAFHTSHVEGGTYNEKYIQWVILEDKTTHARFAVVNTHAVNAIEAGGKPNKAHPKRLALAAAQFSKTAAIMQELSAQMPTFETMDSNVNKKAASKYNSPKFPDAMFGKIGFRSNYDALGYPGTPSHGKRYIDYVYYSAANIAPTKQQSFATFGSDHGGVAMTATLNATAAQCAPDTSTLDATLTDPGPGPKDCDATGIAHCLTPRALNIYKVAKSKWDCTVNPEPGCIRSYGGWRATDVAPDHPGGIAVDMMVTTGDAVNASQAEHGWEEANWFRTNAKALGIQYIIFDAKIWNIDRDAEGWRKYGSITGSDNPSSLHLNHIHVTVSVKPKAA